MSAREVNSGRTVIIFVGYVHLSIIETLLIDSTIEQENKSLERRAITEAVGSKQVSFTSASSIMMLSHFMIVEITFLCALAV